MLAPVACSRLPLTYPPGAACQSLACPIRARPGRVAPSLGLPSTHFGTASSLNTVAPIPRPPAVVSCLLFFSHRRLASVPDFILRFWTKILLQEVKAAFICGCNCSLAGRAGKRSMRKGNHLPCQQPCIYADTHPSYMQDCICRQPYSTQGSRVCPQRARSRPVAAQRSQRREFLLQKPESRKLPTLALSALWCL